MMASRWTPDQSRVLSQLLDQVTGTAEEINIRQDYCRLYDCLASEFQQQNVYFTGSKAEGLDLPGSDSDYMVDVNINHDIKTIHSLHEIPNISPYLTFLMCTDNVHPGFALLQHVPNVHLTMIKSCVQKALQYKNGSQYLSSDLFVEGHHVFGAFCDQEGESFKRQGPSLEYWTKFCDKSDSGQDVVQSIHCEFWPNEATEWTNRVRNFDWPMPSVLSSIIQFGFHLVPIGHPHSNMKSMEWRISFSLAERALVWSFNHVQMQCYALMKILLKEFIKVKCNPQNQVLCSYFIKTFLFWKYETTELNFWREDNLRECMKFLLSDFSQCIREGILRHYFIPRFNLLSVKLTRAAQIELLKLIDIIIESDVSILKQCRTLQNIWSEFLQVNRNRHNVIGNLNKRTMLKNDECMMAKIRGLKIYVLLVQRCSHSLYKTSSKILNTFCKTPIKAMVLKICLFTYRRLILMDRCGSGYKDMYQIHRTAQNDNLSFDISTCKLWCAILLYMKRDFSSTLDIVNQVLSNITPYAMYIFNDKMIACNEDTELYVNMSQNTTVTERAKNAWMFCLFFSKDMTVSMPFGMKIELYFCDTGIWLSPFTCAYYLQFLCYHQMRQYVYRDRTLLQFMDFEENKDPQSTRSSFEDEENQDQQPARLSFEDANILGHCLLLVGQRALARDVFYQSYTSSQRRPPCDKYNSALWYLQNCF